MMTEWISVKDELPEYDWVMVCCDYQSDSPICFAMRYPKSELYPNGKWMFWGNDGTGPYCGDAFSYMDIECITHWMYLPTLPQDK
jgi:hypothetical protein